VKRKRKNRCRVYSLLHSEYKQHDLGGPLVVIQPLRDPVAWRALQWYADNTPNTAQRQTLLIWLREHPCPGEPVVEQMEMAL
jgi:hypothetical protein